MKYDLTKLKKLQEDIHKYRLTNDEEYKLKFSKKKETPRQEGDQKSVSDINSALSGLGDRISGVLLDKVLAESARDSVSKIAQSEIITKISDPLIKELKDAVSGISKIKVTEDDVGTKKVISELIKLQRLISEDSKIDKNKVVAQQLQQVQRSIETLASRQVVVPAPQVVVSMDAVSQRIDELIKTVKSLPKNIQKSEATAFDSKELVEALEKIEKTIIENSKQQVDFPDSISINNFPPQKIPQPVTNININPLRGFVHTTATTVTSSLTTLPGYGVLDNRRAVQVYNNDSSATLFIGGSNVTTSNGMPVPPKSYSQIIDAGERMILYGIISSGSIDVRVMEVSNDSIGG